MDSGELSDLEEGEILEYDSYSPVDSSDDFEIKNQHFNQFKKQNIDNNFGIKENERNWCLTEQDRNENVSRDYKWKNNSNGKLNNLKPIDLESISSDGEYKSNDEEKYSFEPRNSIFKEGRKSKGKDSMHLYGTVEYIMSAIGETIFRKSHCNYKKRKSKEFFKYSDKSYDLWHDKIFSSHIKGKKRKRKISDSDTDSEFLKVHVEERKKRTRKRKVYYEEEGKTTKKAKVRDFDEMRKYFLEKKRKEEAEEKLKALTNSNAPVEVENSEIQEVDMLIECTNYVDDPNVRGENDSVREDVPVEEKEGEDEMDLMQLRLIALASNKKRKIEDNSETRENLVEDEKCEEKNKEKKEEVELDRNELLLRAEALKTALLNKHQKRLHKLRQNKKKSVASLSDNDMIESLLFPTQENVSSKDEEREEKINVENNCEKNERKDEDVEKKDVSDDKESLTKEKESTSVPDANPKKLNQKMRGKRKKKKSFSLANSSKENSEKSETIEEDDNTLRSQLLSDLMRKKCLKDSEKKQVLMDSMQTSTNQILSSAPTGEDSTKEKKKPLQTIKKNCLKNVTKIPVPQIQRIIIHLGSEDSEDSEYENGENKQKINSSLKESEEKVEESVKVESTKKTEKKNEIIKENYEKSVEKLLSEARKKIEGKIQSKKNNATATPEAVYKHLPPSERLEYIRLKQKIAERERQRIQSSVLEKGSNPENSLLNKSSTVSKKNLTQSKVVSVGNSANGTTNKVKTNVASVSVKGTKKHLIGNSNNSNSNSIGSNSLLLPSSQALISKLNLLLKKIKIEKTIEENYEKEISKLKNQLSLFERKKTEQRFKIKKLGEESMKTYKAIQRITAKSTGKASTAVEQKKEEKQENKEEKKEENKEEKKQENKEETKQENKEEKKEEKNVAEENKKEEEKVEKEEEKQEKQEKQEEKVEKAEEKGKNVENEPETDIKKKINKEPNSECENGGRTSERVSNETTTLSVGLLEYSSPLEVFKRASEGAERLDPNLMMCQFDLMGVCKDEECSYQHLRPS